MKRFASVVATVCCLSTAAVLGATAASAASADAVTASSNAQLTTGVEVNVIPWLPVCVFCWE